MPELPEVETVKRTLQQLILGKEIADVEVYWPKIIKRPDDTLQFKHLLIGQKVNDIGRRGKFLIFHLTDYALVSHLRMEGKYGVYRQEEELAPHTHVIFNFTDGSSLRYRDVRKFGTMHLFPLGEEEQHLPLSQLGPEPFSDTFTVELLRNKFQKTERTIKAVLLDQKIMVGLGNIYVDEALFRAGIHPDRKADSIKESELSVLHHEIIQTLTAAVEQGGSTIRSYVNSQGQIGMFQQQLFVYSRKEEPCKKCGTQIEKKVSAGRGTHFCPKCQK